MLIGEMKAKIPKTAHVPLNRESLNLDTDTFVETRMVETAPKEGNDEGGAVMTGF